MGYDVRNLYIVTWGALKPMSWGFYQAYMDEAYAVLSADWISKKLKKAPPGFDIKTLDADLSALVGQKMTLIANGGGAKAARA